MMYRSQLITLFLPYVTLMLIETCELYTSSQEDTTNPASHVDGPIDRKEDETQVEWDYEPRLWTIDSDQDEEPTQEDFANDDSFEFSDMTQYQPEVSSVHKEQHFFGSRLLNHRQYVNTTCNQFRVDIREAVICDKKRCDKLDFDWPKYDNQLTLIETTKHGMRFHRTDLEFATRSREKVESIGSSGKDITNRVKFDIFELFKPKPSTTTSARPESTTTVAPDSNSTQPDSPRQSAKDAATNQLVSTFRLETKRKRQTIIGFGGSLSDSAARNIKSLSPEMAASLMEDYFGNRGLRYNMVRLTIGSSDFSTKPYTNNDISTRFGHPNKQGPMNASFMEDDLEMRNFRLTEDDYLFKIPTVRQAIAISKQELKIIASLWSPPTWMKDNNNIIKGSLKGDIYGPYYRALAELIIKWMEAYKSNGIDFWGLTSLNEPITGAMPFIFHNTLVISRADYILFYKLYMGPMLRQRGFHNVKLMILDDNRGYVTDIVKRMLDDQEMAKYVSGFALHWYMNDEYENLNIISKYYPEKFIISTEACNGFLPFQVHVLPGDWNRGVAYMYDITKMIQSNTVSWVDWNMALDLNGGPSWIKNHVDAAVIVNSKRDEYYKSPMFYAIGHFSKFVEPNSTRLESRLANAKYDYPLQAVAFLTPKNYITIVAFNANNHPVQFRIIVNKQLIRVVRLRADSFNTIVFKWMG